MSKTLPELQFIIRRMGIRLDELEKELKLLREENESLTTENTDLKIELWIETEEVET